MALSGLAYAMGFRGDLAGAMRLAERSVFILREEAAQRDLAEAIIGLCGFLTQTGDYTRAEELGTEALGLLRQWGDTGRVADLLWILGLAALNQQQDVRAVALHEENLALRRARGDQQGAAEPMSALAGIALQQGDYVRAGMLLEETWAMLQHADNPWLRSLVLVLQGHVALAVGDLKRAVRRFTDGAACMQAIGNPLYLGWCLEGFAGVAVVRARWELAARLCGARDGYRARLGLGMPAADPHMYERAVACTRETLGEGGYATAHATGQGLAPDQAIVEARGSFSAE
jgi:tetratricopeptide (TPR) repeat protein